MAKENTARRSNKSYIQERIMTSFNVLFLCITCILIESILFAKATGVNVNCRKKTCGLLMLFAIKQYLHFLSFNLDKWEPCVWWRFLFCLQTVVSCEQEEFEIKNRFQGRKISLRQKIRFILLHSNEKEKYFWNCWKTIAVDFHFRTHTIWS